MGGTALQLLQHSNRICSDLRQCINYVVKIIYWVEGSDFGRQTNLGSLKATERGCVKKVELCMATATCTENVRSAYDFGTCWH